MSTTTIFKPNVVYNKLKEMIIYLELKPGDLVSETETSQLFNVSRTSVRSAFKKLETEGLIEIAPKKGTYVSLISMEAINDILFMRESVEVSCIRYLTTQESGISFYKLNSILKKQKALINNDEIEISEKAKLFFKYDNEFHHMIFKLAGRERIWEVLSKIDYQYSRFRVFLNITDNDNFLELYEAHNEIFETILSGDESGIEKLFHDHIYNGIRLSSNKINEKQEYFADK